MEDAKEIASAKERVNEMLENKAENDIGSDRESSIESFHTNKSHLSLATESELIDIDDIELSDEESWLYQSPKKLSTDERATSSGNWFHKDAEEMNNLELHIAKNALISKLNELKIQNSDLEKHESSETQSMKDDLDFGKKAKEYKTSSNSMSDKNEKSDVCVKSQETRNNEQCKADGTDKLKHNGAKIEQNLKIKSSNDSQKNDTDATEIRKIARLQEESLRQSMSRFLSQAEKRPSIVEKASPIEHVDGIKLTKPISAEALNVCNGKLAPSGVLTSLSPYSIKQQNYFGSTATLSQNQNHDIHRGSLPNINKGYYSLRPKKSKLTEKTHCPLPIYPTHQKSITSGASEASIYESQSKLLSPPPNEGRESRTLPSSYRINSRSNSTPRREHSAHPPLRRESSPFISCQKNFSSFDLNRRDSTPCNPRKLLSPVKSPTQFKRCSASSPMLQSPPKAANSVHPIKKLSPNSEHHRQTAHSSYRQQPLSVVHNQSPHRSNNQSLSQNGEIKAPKPPSKIPSPASRSGIPVPSTHYISRQNDKSWSQDCF